MKPFHLLFSLLLSFPGLGLAQTVVLHGTVTNSEGLPVEGATVTAASRTTSTDEQGGFTFKNLLVGKLILQIHAISYGPQSDTLQLQPGVNTHNIQLTKQHKQLGDMTVTAQRLGNRNAETLVKVENSIMPVTIINRRTIELMGSRRLDEVVKEQTGIAIVNDITAGARAVGVQMQGFSSEYILVLIDGEPMVGSNGGNFDLSRISVSNVERVEITKGASSLIYGGNALGGTINVITRHHIDRPQAYASVNYGTYGTVDATLDGESPVLKKRGGLTINTNYYHTDGFNTSQGLIKGTTAPPFDDYGAQGRFRYQFNDNNLLSVMGRFGLRRSIMNKDFDAKYTTKDVLSEDDINLSANFDHRFADRWHTMTRYYLTRYTADMGVTLQDGDSLSQTKFGQLLNRLEQQLAYTIPNKLDVIAGTGGTVESIDQNILSGQRSITSYFGYTQANWKVLPKLEVTGGFRYDHILRYGWRLDPSGAIKYRVLPVLTVKAAYGTAFKAPDMRKMYQVVYNPVGNNLTVGNAVLRNTINELLARQQVSQYELEPVYNEIKGLNLNAEMSKSYNVSVIFETLNQKAMVEGMVFYHDIHNQINPVLVGRDINNNLIYSYMNNASAFYKGAEFSFSLSPVRGLQISGGYQYLLAIDRSVRDQIKPGGKYYTPLFDPNTGYINYTPSAKDYWGMEDRSRHMFNARVFYTYQPWQLSGNIRVSYRGKYPFSDLNSNGYFDRFDTFVRQYYLLNAGIEKKWLKNRLTVRLTAENLLNFVDPKVPSQPGRQYFAGVAYQFLHQ